MLSWKKAWLSGGTCKLRLTRSTRRLNHSKYSLETPRNCKYAIIMLTTKEFLISRNSLRLGILTLPRLVPRFRPRKLESLNSKNLMTRLTASARSTTSWRMSLAKFERPKQVCRVSSVPRRKNASMLMAGSID